MLPVHCLYEVIVLANDLSLVFMQKKSDLHLNKSFMFCDEFFMLTNRLAQ
jgi:hypothetical protein